MMHITIVSAPETPKRYWGIVEEHPEQGVRCLPVRLDLSEAEARDYCALLNATRGSAGHSYSVARMSGR